MRKEFFVYDRTLRDLLKELPERFIFLLTGKNGTRFIDTSLPKVKERRPDLLVELEDKSIFHLEVQTREEKDIDIRMLEYYILLKQVREIKGKKINQMVLFLKELKDNEREYDKKRKVSFDNGKLIFEYDVRYINDIECKPLIESKSIDDNILATLCKIDNPEYFWNKLKEKLNKLDDKKREDYVRKLLALLRLRPNLFYKIKSMEREVNKMPLIINKKKDPFYRMGIEEGIEEGLQKGLREGEVGAKVEIVEKQLMGKFGKDIEGYINNVENLSKEKLDYIIEHIFDITLDEVKEILNR